MDVSAPESVWGLVGTLLGLTGIVLAVFFYLRAKRDRRPFYHASTTPLVGPDATVYDELTLQYKGKKIPTLSSTIVSIWNHGRETIDRRDIAPQNPIVITCDDPAEFLSSSVIDSTKPACQFTVTPAGERRVIIDFEFLDYKDTAQVLLLHTAAGGGAIHIFGTIKGGGDIRPWKIARIWDYGTLLFVLCASLSMLIGRWVYDVLPAPVYLAAPAGIIVGLGVALPLLSLILEKGKPVPPFVSELQRRNMVT